MSLESSILKKAVRHLCTQTLTTDWNCTCLSSRYTTVSHGTKGHSQQRVTPVSPASAINHTCTVAHSLLAVAQGFQRQHDECISRQQDCNVNVVSSLQLDGIHSESVVCTLTHRFHTANVAGDVTTRAAETKVADGGKRQVEAIEWKHALDEAWKTGETVLSIQPTKQPMP